MSKIMQGYKQTKVGIIPEDWEVAKLEKYVQEICKKNKDEKTKNVLSVTNTYGFISQKDFFERAVASKDTSNYKIVEKGNFAYNPSRINVGSIALLNDFKIGILSPMYVIFECFNGLDKDYFHYWLKSHQFIGNLYRYLSGSVRNSLAFKDMQKMKIPLPPLKEQEKIAQILSTWDEGISTLKALIAAKTELKKVLMQQLLTGKVRFAGFSDEWKEVKLGDIGNHFNGLSGKTAADFETGNAKYITYLNILENSTINLGVLKNVKVSSKEKQNLVQFGDIFFTISSETPEEVGMCAVLLENATNTYLNSFCFGFRLNSFDVLNPNFARFYFRSFYMRDIISKFAQGSTRFNLSKKTMMKLKLLLPTLTEQQRIAEVLSLADKEIDLLKKELDELVQQKKGIMQQLLTGQVRVKAR